MTKNSMEKAAQNRYTPDELTRKLAEVNKFDLNSLSANRQGRLSVNQFLVSLAVSISFIVNFVCYYFVIRGVVSGWILISFGSTLQGIGWLAAAVTAVIVFWGKSKLGPRFGFERYAAKDLSYLPIKILVVIDMLRGRVEEYRGTVFREMSSGIVYTRDHRNPENPFKRDPFAEKQKIFYPEYNADNVKFPVSFEAYDALTVRIQDCRLYYLPLSMIMVNLEVV